MGELKDKVNKYLESDFIDQEDLKSLIMLLVERLEQVPSKEDLKKIRIEFLQNIDIPVSIP